MLKRTVGDPVRARDDVSGIVERAILAHGGEAGVGKLRSARVKVEGKAALLPNQPDATLTLEDVWQMPHRYKSMSRIKVRGREVAQTLCMDGRQGWIDVNGQVEAISAAAFKEMQEQKWAEDFDRLLPLRDESL